jgi:hypothetical protein
MLGATKGTKSTSHLGTLLRLFLSFKFLIVRKGRGECESFGTPNLGKVFAFLFPPALPIAVSCDLCGC